MSKIEAGLQEIISQYQNKLEPFKKEIKEIATGYYLISPILKLAGWNIHNSDEVKWEDRSVRSSNFDIICKSGDDPQIVIEYKRIDSPEFNIDKNTNDKGALKLDQFWKQRNIKSQDGIGQLRRYCVNSTLFKGKDSPLPILTNGYKWVIFHPKFYEKADEKLKQNITNDMIISQKTIEDAEFKKEIFERLMKS